MGNTARQCILGLFQDSDSAGDLEDSKSTSGVILVHFRKQNICAKKLDVQETKSVSHSSTEAEVVSLDSGLRMDESQLSSLGFW